MHFKKYNAFSAIVFLLFCRCVLNWFGDWSTGALYQVGQEFTQKLDVEKSDVRKNTHIYQIYFLYVAVYCSKPSSQSVP